MKISRVCILERDILHRPVLLSCRESLKYFYQLHRYAPKTNVDADPPNRPPNFIILIIRFFRRKSWLNRKLYP